MFSRKRISSSENVVRGVAAAFWTSVSGIRNLQEEEWRTYDFSILTETKQRPSHRTQRVAESPDFDPRALCPPWFKSLDNFHRWVVAFRLQSLPTEKPFIKWF